MLSRSGQKQVYFNHYWQTRDLPSADARSRQRAALVQSLLPMPQGNKLLEVGCGRGEVIRFLTAQGYHIEGCDIASETVSKLKADGFEVFLCDLEQDPIPGRFDVILCLEVLQQLFDPTAALQRLAACLNPGGRLIVSVPNEFHLQSRLKLLTGKSHLGHFDQSHIRLFTPQRARELFERAGLTVEVSIPVSAFPPGLKFMKLPGQILANSLPGLFSLSQIYRLKVT
jgi:2-polyprenyl-3-methyl-5-hydroxy-6-metoxy-1,4-benzoquinol methylase